MIPLLRNQSSKKNVKKANKRKRRLISDSDKIDETKTFEHAIVPNLYKLWLNCHHLQDFNFTLVQAVTEGLKSV